VVNHVIAHLQAAAAATAAAAAEGEVFDHHTLATTNDKQFMCLLEHLACRCCSISGWPTLCSVCQRVQFVCYQWSSRRGLLDFLVCCVTSPL
jgi:hypothetical protein